MRTHIVALSTNCNTALHISPTTSSMLQVFSSKLVLCQGMYISNVFALVFTYFAMHPQWKVTQIHGSSNNNDYTDRTKSYAWICRRRAITRSTRVVGFRRTWPPSAIMTRRSSRIRSVKPVPTHSHPCWSDSLSTAIAQCISVSQTQHCTLNGSTVVQLCYNGDVAFLWGKGNSEPPVTLKPRTRHISIETG